MNSAEYMRENYCHARRLNPTASNSDIGEGFARTISSLRLSADVAPIGNALDAMHHTGSKQKRYPDLRKQHIADWKHPALAFGPLILGVALIGLSAGAHAKDAPAKSPESPLAQVLPAARSSSDTLAAPDPSSSADEPDFISPEVIERARQRIRARASVGALHSRSSQERPRDEPAANDGQQPPPLPAKLPLPNKVIARTIERIGYPCGAVASATALEGDEPGMYKVTCTSGHSYQARPVHGRYHFRRW